MTYSIISIDTCTSTDEDNYRIPPEFLYSLTPPGMPPHELNMKINGIYILLRNWMSKMVSAIIAGSFFGTNPHTLHCDLIQDGPTYPPY